jgi:phosphate starvation-inducible protein PhoH and related proteins
MEKLIEKIYTLAESINPLRIYGQNDSHLKFIENELEVRLIARGHKVKIIGSEIQVNRTQEVLDEICQIFTKKDNLTNTDIETALKIYASNMIQQNGDSIDYDVSMQLRTLNGPIYPKSDGQKFFLESFKKNDVIFTIGPAGTGKTYLAVAVAVSYLKNQLVKKIVLARPAVEAGESLGFLPGDFKEKIDPYLKPLYDALEDMLPKDMLKKYYDMETIEILPLAYMRGRTLNNAFVILDEAQNSTFTQMKMFLTRLGFNSKAVITGDITQIDLPGKQESGLVSSIKVLSDIEGIGFIRLGRSDVVRHPLVKDIIDAYDKYANSK